MPAMVLVADGTTDARRSASLNALARAVAARGETEVVPAFGGAEDVRSVLRGLRGPAVATPAYVAGGDVASAALFDRIDLGARPDRCATDPLGAVPSLVADLAVRLTAGGHRSGGGVVLAADGPSGQDERRAVADVARMLSRRLEAPVRVGYLNAWAPTVADAADRLHRGGHRVSIATWRLVDDAGSARLRALGGTVTVTDPLSSSGLVVDALLARHRAATARLAA